MDEKQLIAAIEKVVDLKIYSARSALKRVSREKVSALEAMRDILQAYGGLEALLMFAMRPGMDVPEPTKDLIKSAMTRVEEIYKEMIQAVWGQEAV